MKKKKNSHDVLVRNDLDFPLLIVSPKPRSNGQLRRAWRSTANRHRKNSAERAVSNQKRENEG
jgi:hypothetical protein